MIQQALTQSGVRAAISDKALADLARREQDTGYQIAARERVLAGAQSVATGQQNSQALDRLHVEVEQLRIARARLRAEIEQRFPSYAQLTDPHPASSGQTQAVLSAHEAIVSIYTAETETYVWAVPRDGAIAFATVPIAREQLDAMVGELRGALDPHVATLGDIPPFNVALAHKLYAAILEPVRAGWQGSQATDRRAVWSVGRVAVFVAGHATGRPTGGACGRCALFQLQIRAFPRARSDGDSSSVSSGVGDAARAAQWRSSAACVCRVR